jgi:hypothetical protein
MDRHPIGLPVPSTELSIRDDDGRERPPGERREICIRGETPRSTKCNWKCRRSSTVAVSGERWRNAARYRTART